MVQYVDTKTASHGIVRKVVLLHMVPGDGPDRFLVSIDVCEHEVRAPGGMRRGRGGPRITRKLVLEPMTDDAAREAAEAIARAEGILYICVDRETWRPAASGGPAHAAAGD
jgi:hypothetical protein